MNTKKLFALFLALIMTLSCLSLNAFAATNSFEKDFLLNIPHITTGMTVEQLKNGISFADATIGEDIELIDAVFYDSIQNANGTVAAPEHDQIFITFQLKDNGNYTTFSGKAVPPLPVKTYNAEVTFKDGSTDLANKGTYIGNTFNTTTHEPYNNGEGDSKYCQVRCAVTVYDGMANLDLDTTSANKDMYSDTTTVVQKYDATVTANNTDVTKVQVSWELQNISASVTVNKIWNTETLTWDADTNKTDTATASAVTAKFDFVNLSSKRLIGKVQFDVNTTDGFTEPESIEYTDKAVALLTKADDADCDNTNSITVEIQANGDDFSEKSGKGTYGTYKVSITDAQYLTFKATEANSTVTPNFLSGSWEYTTDNGITWKDGTNYTYNGEGEIADESKVTKITLANVNDTVKLRGDDCVTGWDDNYNCMKFSMTGKITASGDVTAITNGVGDDAKLTDNCYGSMFSGCESLTQTPALPSTIMAARCYLGMFFGCTSLEEAPELPATTLADSCYWDMFNNCTSLKEAPELPATTMAKGCYAQMFFCCTSLKEAPELPATTLADECYNGMFVYCTSLKEAPKLPAKKLKVNCYSFMFYSCTSLEEAPELPATTLAEYCYDQMFQNCTSLKKATQLPEAELKEYCYHLMFNGCTSLKVQVGGEAPKNGGLIYVCSSDTESSKHMFAGTDTISELKGDYDEIFEMWKGVYLTPGTAYYWYIEE